MQLEPVAYAYMKQLQSSNLVSQPLLGKSPATVTPFAAPSIIQFRHSQLHFNYISDSTLSKHLRASFMLYGVC